MIGDSISRWRVISASVAGTSHQRTGRGCDDACLYRVSSDNTLFLAVADGAGSASQSARGAAVAVQAAIDAAELTLLHQGEPTQQEQWQELLANVLKAAHNALCELQNVDSFTTDDADVIEERREARETREAGNNSDEGSETITSPTLRDFATTLLVVIVTQSWIAAAQVGDGIMVRQFEDGSVASLPSRQKQGFFNETDFITDTNYLKSAMYNVLARNNLQGIALLTDGLQLLAAKYPENTAHPGFFQPLFKFAASSDATEKELRAFLDSERVNRQTDDDKTLLLAVIS